MPAFWRPPYGDADNRVRAIAKEIFGLTTVIWNYDSDDWNIGQADITLDSVEANMEKILSGPKSPGLVILEHEIDANEVDAFLAAYPYMKSNSWPIKTIPDLTGLNWYQNSKDNLSPVTPMDHFGQYPPKPPTSIATTPPAALSSAASQTSEATQTTAVSLSPSNNNNNLSGSSSPTSAPCRWNTLIFLTLSLGAYYYL